MDDSPLVAVQNGADHLHNDLSRLNLRKFSFLANVSKELATPSILHDHNELLLLHKGMMQLNNILMAQFLQILRLLKDVLHSVGISN